MLSSVLDSDRAVKMSIFVVRAFNKLREMLSTHKDLQRKIEEMEKKYDHNFQSVFQAIKELLNKKEKLPAIPRVKGFVSKN
jgi:uncharacterized protein Yka (UPF0111/DUF47 family)